MVRTKMHNPTRLRFVMVALSTIVLLVMACILSGCSKNANVNAIKVKSGAGEIDLAAKSASAFAVTKTFTDINRKVSTAVSHRVYVANYDLDTTQFVRSMDKPMSADDQVRVVFSLVGAEGTTDQSPATVGTFAANADRFMKVEDVNLVTRAGGQDNKLILDRKNLSGAVKVESVSADAVTGTIDLAGGDTSIKGPFTAKILRRN